MSAPFQVTFQDAYDQIARGSPNAASWVQWWRRKYANIVPAVEGMVHRRLFELSSSDVATTLERGTHALGEIEREREIREVEDTQMPDTAMQDLFHGFVERERALPTWEEFRAYLREPKQKAVFLTPWRRTLRRVLAGRYEPDSIREAVQWRVARMYYSNLREVDFLARVRERHDVQLSYHVFADVRLRTDFWFGNHNISVFLSNSRYRSKGQTRKDKAAELLGDRVPPFTFHEVEFPNRYDRGHLYRVTDSEIDELVAVLRPNK